MRKYESSLDKSLARTAINRRRFLYSTTGAAIAASSSTLLLSQRSAGAQTPKRGGRIRLATPDSSPADTLDPAKENTKTDILRCFFLYERLTDIDTDGKLVPMLATSWSSDEKATKWTFELRKDVIFHNGKPFTSADVVHTYTRALAKETKSAGAVFFSNVARVVADGPQRVVFELNSSNAEFSTTVSIRWLSIVQDGAQEFPKDAIGTGPWKVKEFKPGLGALFVRHDNYWRNGLPYIDEIESVGIGDLAARQNALLSGQVDVVSTIDPKVVRQFEASSAVKPLVITGSPYLVFPMQSDKPPFNNAEVRTAMKHAFDGKRFVELAFDGMGTPARDNPIAPYDAFFCSEPPVPAADPDKVKSLLKKAGLENYAFELHTSDAVTGGSNTAVVLGELMKQNGVNVTVKKTPADSYWSATYKKVPWFTSSWTGQPTAITRIEAGYLSTSPYNEAIWSSPKVDALIAQAKQELDEAKRKQMLCDAQTIISSEGGAIIPMFIPWVDAYSTKVKNLKAHPMMTCGMGQWADVWLA